MHADCKSYRQTVSMKRIIISPESGLWLRPPPSAAEERLLAGR